MALVNLERKAEPKYENLHMYTIIMTMFTNINFTVVLPCFQKRRITITLIKRKMAS